MTTRRFGVLAFLALALVGSFAALAFADATAPAAATATVAAAQAAPQFPALPTSFSLISIVGFVFALFGWLGWFSSELMAILPTKWNGWLHGFLTLCGAFSQDPTGKITLQLSQIQSGIAELKAGNSTGTQGS